MSEFDRQVKLFNEKIKNPDRVIKAHSKMEADYPEEGGKVYWFLSNDDTVTMVDMRDED